LRRSAPILPPRDGSSSSGPSSPSPPASAYDEESQGSADKADVLEKPHAEETRNPQRDVPRGILWSLGICALLYMAVAFVVTGMSKYSSLDTGAPLAKAFSDVGVDWASKVISVGAVCGITTVILVLLLGQSRVLFAMSRDHLLPPAVARVHPRFGTPWLITIGTGAVVAIVAGFVPLAKLSELTSIGTLFAFVVVAIGVVVLRRTRPDLPRSFRTPWVPVLPIVAVLACLWLMINLPVDTWIRFVIWMAIGFVLYFTYGMRAAGRQRASEAVAEGEHLDQRLVQPIRRHFSPRSRRGP